MARLLRLILVFDDDFTLHDSRDGSDRRLRRPFVAGLHITPALVGSRGRAAAIQVDLTPVGAWRLLRADMGELAGEVVELSEFTSDVACLAQQLPDLRS